MQEYQPLPPESDLLEACLIAIEEHELSIDECLSRMPDHSHGLRPMLITALQLRQAATVQPSMTFRQKASKRLLARLEDTRQRSPQQHQRPLWVPVGLAGALAGLMLVALAAVLMITAQPQASNSAPVNTPEQVSTPVVTAPSLPPAVSPSAESLAPSDLAGDEIDALLQQLDDLNNTADPLEDQP